MGWDGMGLGAREGMRALFAIERARAGGDVRDRARAARGTFAIARAGIQRGSRASRMARGWRVRDRGFDSTAIGVR